jgi:hypothetical protein
MLGIGISTADAVATAAGAGAGAVFAPSNLPLGSGTSAPGVTDLDAGAAWTFGAEGWFITAEDLAPVAGADAAAAFLDFGPAATAEALTGPDAFAAPAVFDGPGTGLVATLALLGPGALDPDEPLATGFASFPDLDAAVEDGESSFGAAAAGSAKAISAAATVAMDKGARRAHVMRRGVLSGSGPGPVLGRVPIRFPPKRVDEPLTEAILPAKLPVDRGKSRASAVRCAPNWDRQQVQNRCLQRRGAFFQVA